MKTHSTTKIAGFTLIELMIAMGVTMILLYAAVATFRDASQSNQMVVQAADMSDNLRAGLNMIQLDLQQVGTGIPKNGIPIPFTAPCDSTPRINRPMLGGISTFPYPGANCDQYLHAVEPGSLMGPPITAPDAIAGTAANPNSITDEITMLYADNTSGLDGQPINQPANPPISAGCPAGSLTLAGTTLTVKFDPTCLNLANNPNNIKINSGDLIMFSNTSGIALLCVTAVNTGANTLTFSSGDAFDLNGRAENSGTIQQIQSAGVFPPTLATRIWMITYYLDNVTSPPYNRLIRQVNLNPPTPVGETLENLQFTYNYVDGINNPSNQPSVPIGNSENNIRSVNVYLGARSSRSVQQGSRTIYARSNLMSQVSLRSMAAINNYE